MGPIYMNRFDLIKSRTIQECPTWSFEYLHMVHKEFVVLKLDFVKDFDNVEHQCSMMEIMEHEGFTPKCLS